MFPCRTDPASRTLAVAQGQEGLPAESVEYEGKCYGLDTLQPKLHGRRGRNHTARRNPDTKLQLRESGGCRTTRPQG